MVPAHLPRVPCPAHVWARKGFVSIMGLEGPKPSEQLEPSGFPGPSWQPEAERESGAGGADVPQTGEGQGAGTPAPQLSLPTTLGALPVVGSDWNVSCRRGRGGGQVTPVQGAAYPQCHWLGEHRQAGDAPQPGEWSYKKHPAPYRAAPLPHSSSPGPSPSLPSAGCRRGPPAPPLYSFLTRDFLYHCRE